MKGKGEEDIGVCEGKERRIWKGREIWGREVERSVQASPPNRPPSGLLLTRPDFGYLAPPILFASGAQSPAFAAAEALQGMVTASR